MKNIGDFLLITRSAVRARPGEPYFQILSALAASSKPFFLTIPNAVPNIQWLLCCARQTRFIYRHPNSRRERAENREHQVLDIPTFTFFVDCFLKAER